MKYDYMYEGGRTRGASGSKKLRLVSIFIVVAAVTGFVIWKTMPSDGSAVPSPSGVKTPSPDVPASEKNSPAQTAGPGGSESASNGNSPRSSAGGGGSSAVKVSGAASAPDAVSGSAQGRASVGANGVQTAKAPDEKNVAGQPRRAAQTAVYGKGKVGPRDPAPKNDTPLIPAEKSDADAAGRQLAELSTAFARKDHASVSASAPKVLSTLTPGSAPYRAAMRLLSDANWARIVSRDTSGGFAVKHVVGAGEYLGRIARKNKTTVSLVMLVNGLKNSNIMVGQRLVLLPGRWKITVSKKRRQLELWRNEAIFMGFDVGVGRFGSTPSALFVISDRLKHPVYRTPDGRVFQHGEPGNELGDYFLKLAPSGTPAKPLLGYGIHGTADESSVMRSLSSGCIRMRNADAEKLYLIVPAGTPVEIGE